MTETNNHMHSIYKTGYRGVLLLICAFGLSIGLFKPGGFRVQICYFTTLSNLLVFIYFSCMLPRKTHDHPLLHGAVATTITITMIVYHSMTVYSQMEGIGFRDLFLHYLTPMLVLFDFLLFCPKGRVKWFYPLIWLILPSLYYGYMVLRANIGAALEFTWGLSRYPYFIFDVNVVGAAGFLISSCAAVLASIAVGFIMYGLNRAACLLSGRDERRDCPPPQPVEPVHTPPHHENESVELVFSESEHKEKSRSKVAV